MAKERDILELMPPDVRAAVFRGALFSMFGERNGAKAWRQVEPLLRSTLRQLGDAPVPEQNYWEGAWRIYELD